MPQRAYLLRILRNDRGVYKAQQEIKRGTAPPLSRGSVSPVKPLSSGVRLHRTILEEEIETLLKTSTGTGEEDKKDLFLTDTLRTLRKSTGYCSNPNSHITLVISAPLRKRRFLQFTLSSWLRSVTPPRFFHTATLTTIFTTEDDTLLASFGAWPSSGYITANCPACRCTGDHFLCVAVPKQMSLSGS